MRARSLWLAALVVAGACSPSTTVGTSGDVVPDSPHAAADDVAHLFEYFSGRIYGGDRIRTVGRLADYLPNTHGRYVDDSSEPAELHPDSVIVVGEITDVRPDHAFIEGSGDRPEQTRRYVAFDDPAATSRRWLLTFRVDETFGDAPEDRMLTGGVGTLGDLATAARYANGLRSIGPALFVIERDHGRFFPDRDDVWVIGVGGILIAPLGDGGTLSWPMLRGAEQTTMLEGAETLDQLRARAAEPVRYVEIEHYGESWRPVRERPVEPPPETGPPGPPIAIGD